MIIPDLGSFSPTATELVGEITMEEYAEMGRVIIFGTKQIAGEKAIGKGQCPLCHTFDAGDNIGRYGVRAGAPGWCSV